MTADMACGNKKYRSYEYLVAAFGEEKIKSRYCFLERSAKRFVENRNLQKYVRVNSFLIQEIVCDYFADIQRLKEFHELERTNPIKVAAYTAFWISRRKPLYLVCDAIDEEVVAQHPELVDINEWFSTFVLIADAFDKRTPLFMGLFETKSFNIFSQNVRYFLIYRIFTAQALELALVGLMSMCMYPPRDAEKSS
jgi:hypothetical protein